MLSDACADGIIVWYERPAYNKITFITAKPTAVLGLDKKVVGNRGEREQQSTSRNTNPKTRQSGLEEQVKKKQKGKNGADSDANARQSVCSTWSPSIARSLVHTAPVKTASLHNGHVSNGSLSAAGERHSVHLSGTERAPAAVTTESTSVCRHAHNGDASITGVTAGADDFHSTV